MPVFYTALVILTVELVFLIAAGDWYARRPNATRRFVRFLAQLLIVVTVGGVVLTGALYTVAQAT